MSVSAHHVLIVEDETFTRKVSVQMFKLLDVRQIHEAENGEHGLAILDQHPEIDFILCDLAMPEMDGREFIRHLSDRKYQGAIAVASGEDNLVLSSVEELANVCDIHFVGAVKKPLTKQTVGTLLQLSAKPSDAASASEPS